MLSLLTLALALTALSSFRSASSPPTGARAFSFPGLLEPRFKQGGFVALGNLGVPDDEGLVAAFADGGAGGDQLLELVHLSADQRTLSLYAWSRDAFAWHKLDHATVRAQDVVTNVVPGDFDYDGRLDLLVMTGHNPGGWWGKDSQTEMQLFLGASNRSFDTSAKGEIPPSSLAQPLVLDANGDMHADLLAVPAGNDQELRLWSNAWHDSTNSSQPFDLSDPPFELDEPCEFPSPHSNAFVDLNGDCLADVFLMCDRGNGRRSFQIWLNDKASATFTKGPRGDLPDGTRTVAFADMDRDGTTDMLITACDVHNDKECDIYVAYNDQIPLCANSLKRSSRAEHEEDEDVPLGCRDPEDLCVADDDFAFNLELSNENPSLIKFKASDLLDDGETLITTSDAFRGVLPTPPQIGDYNVDGYPDLLVLAAGGWGKRRVRVLESVPCSSHTKECTRAHRERSRRAFTRVTKGVAPLDEVEDAESATWVDVDDDGALDVMVQRTGDSGKGGGSAARKVAFFKNNYFHDAFFLKALVLNGACQAWCDPSAPGESKYRPYGSSYSGASYKFTVLDPSGSRKATQVAQLAQTSYLSLQTPYSHFGLGRTNNYVENLFIGSTRRQAQHFMNIEGVIPNSQVVIAPFQPRGVEADPSWWTKELYLHPGDWIPWVTIVLGAAIAILGVVVLVLHLNEKRQDEQERKARLIQLNFSAL